MFVHENYTKYKAKHLLHTERLDKEAADTK